MKYEEFEKKQYEKKTGIKTVHVVIHNVNEEVDHREWVPWNFKAFLIKKSKFLHQCIVILEGSSVIMDLKTADDQKKAYQFVQETLEEEGKMKLIRVDIYKN